MYLFVFFSIPAFAQEQATTTINFPQKIDEIKQHIEEKKIEFNFEIEQKRLEIKQQIELSNSLENETRLSILSHERVLKAVINVFELFDAVLVKFDGIITRIDARMSKLSEDNIDTLESEKLLDIAKEKLKESIILITSSKIELELAMEGNISKEEIKNIINSCKTSLKVTQSSLADVIDSLKSVSSDQEGISLE